MGPLLIKPAEMMLFYTGADKMEPSSLSLVMSLQSNISFHLANSGWPSCHRVPQSWGLVDLTAVPRPTGDLCRFRRPAP